MNDFFYLCQTGYERTTQIHVSLNTQPSSGGSTKFLQSASCDRGHRINDQITLLKHLLSTPSNGDMMRWRVKRWGVMIKAYRGFYMPDNLQSTSTSTRTKIPTSLHFYFPPTYWFTSSFLFPSHSFIPFAFPSLPWASKAYAAGLAEARHCLGFPVHVLKSRFTVVYFCCFAFPFNCRKIAKKDAVIFCFRNFTCYRWIISMLGG